MRIRGMSVRIALVDTSARGSNGSMSRYADLLQSALGGDGIVRICLGLPQAMLDPFSGRFRTWFQHGWNLAVGRSRLAAMRVDCCHILDGSHAYVAEWLDPARCIVTCHDLIPALQAEGRLPGTPGRLAVAIVTRSMRVLARARHVVAVSDSTRRDAIRLAGLDPERVSVIPNALAPEWLDLRALPLAAAPPANPPAILHIGNNAPYKNRAGVIRVFAQVRRRLVARMIMAGAESDSVLERLAAEQGVATDIEWVPQVPESRLRALYRSASLLLFPSLYEGFGWPVLEAMACGCPVVCSNAGSLPEVAGNAALMAAPDDESALAAHCVAVLEDSGLRASLVEQGTRRVAGFTTTRMIEGIRRIYAS